MEYLTNCTVQGSGEAITAMVDASREITLRTFQKHVGRAATLAFEKDMGYADRKAKTGLKMQADWAIRYYKSTFKGQRCCYIDHSSIEYVFV